MRILLTGGSGGIGKSIYNKFISNGHEVIAPTREELNLLSPVVLSDTEYDIIINNAGINPLHDITDLYPEQIMRVNYLSPLEIIQQCIPHMKRGNYGRIINIGSIWIDFAKPKRHFYSASKNALHALTKSIASEYSEYNILCNTVSPGYIRTAMTYINNKPEDIDKIQKDIPQQRLGEPHEVADLIYFLTINNTYITGQNITIDGGFSCSVL
mgnify:CR=1 FL=1